MSDDTRTVVNLSNFGLYNFSAFKKGWFEYVYLCRICCISIYDFQL